MLRSSGDDKLYKLRALCATHKINVVLKGAHTAVCNSSGEIHFNATGNPGMATAGSGDVLTGILGSLLAQGVAPFDAARLGTYLHGLAGDYAAEKQGTHGMIASDIIKAIPAAIQSLTI